MVRKCIASVCILFPFLLFSAPITIPNDEKVILLYHHDDNREETDVVWDDLIFADSVSMSNGMLDIIRLKEESFGKEES